MSLLKVFASLFQKATADPTRVRWSPSADGETPFLAFLFCQAFFFAPMVSKKKAVLMLAKALWDKGSPPLVRLPSVKPTAWHSPLPWRFLRQGDFAICGWRPPIAAAPTNLFEKGLIQNFLTDYQNKPTALRVANVLKSKFETNCKLNFPLLTNGENNDILI